MANIFKTPVARLIALTVFGGLSAQSVLADTDGFMGAGSYGGSFMGHGFGVLFWVLIAALLIYLLQKTFSATSDKPAQTPLDILQTRFASGEIDAEQYEESIKTLGN